MTSTQSDSKRLKKVRKKNGGLGEETFPKKSKMATFPKNKMVDLEKKPSRKNPKWRPSRKTKWRLRVSAQDDGLGLGLLCKSGLPTHLGLRPCFAGRSCLISMLIKSVEMLDIYTLSDLPSILLPTVLGLVRHEKKKMRYMPN